MIGFLGADQVPTHPSFDPVSQEAEKLCRSRSGGSLTSSSIENKLLHTLIISRYPASCSWPNLQPASGALVV